MNDDILHIEERSLNAHPALETQFYDGWVLRFAGGYTKRANSVNPLYAMAFPMPEKVAFCEAAYSRQGLPTVFKLTPVSPEGLDDYLIQAGYEQVAPTQVLTCSLNAGPIDAAVTITDEIDARWQHSFFALNSVSDKLQSTASAMLGHIRQDLLCASIEQDGRIIACGLAVTERGWVGLYDIVVDASCRQQGYGYRLCSALLNAAYERGAHHAYLQVVAANTPARALYNKLGLAYYYTYWYRVKA